LRINQPRARFCSNKHEKAVMIRLQSSFIIILLLKKITGGKNITESLIVALEELVALKRVRTLNDRVREASLEF